MTFNESNTVEAFIRDLLCGDITHHTAVGPGLARLTPARSPASAGTSSRAGTCPANPGKHWSRTISARLSSA